MDKNVRPTRVRYLVLAWMCVFAMVVYVHRSCIAVPTVEIEHDLGLSRDEMALVLSMFLWGYAALQLPAGLIGDSWGSRLVLPGVVLFSSLMTAWQGLAFGFWSLVMGRFLMGVAQAGVFPCAVLTFAKWFPVGQRAFPSGLLGSSMSVGAVVATALTGLLLKEFSWREVTIGFALPGMALAVWFYVWFRENPAEHPSVNAEEVRLIEGDGQSPAGGVQTSEVSKTSEIFGEPTPWRRIFTSPAMACLCGQQFFRAAGYIFYLTWGPRFLQEARGISVSDSGLLTSLALLGVVIGSPAGGFLSDWIYRRTKSLSLSRKGVAVVNMLAAGSCLVLAYGTLDPLWTMIWLTGSSFFAGLGGPVGYTASIDLGGKHVATVFSLMNMSGNIGAALLPLAVVRIEEWSLRKKLTDPVWFPGFEEWLQSFALIPNGWNEVLLFLAALYLMAAICWLALRIRKI